MSTMGWDRALGSQLLALRRRRGLSHAQVGFQRGATPTVVAAWEHGVTRPRRARLPHLAEVLGTELDELARLAGCPDTTA